MFCLNYNNNDCWCCQDDLFLKHNKHIHNRTVTHYVQNDLNRYFLCTNEVFSSQSKSAQMWTVFTRISTNTQRHSNKQIKCTLLHTLRGTHSHQLAATPNIDQSKCEQHSLWSPPNIVADRTPKHFLTTPSGHYFSLFCFISMYSHAVYLFSY